MSTFTGCMKEYKAISIDRFNGENLDSTVYFLSHKHLDHMVGIDHSSFEYRLKSNNKIKLYCSEVTKLLLLADRKFQHLEQFIECLHLGTSLLIKIPDPQTDQIIQEVTVTALDAGHCPGSVMLFFEGREGNVLYTGDFRFNEGGIQTVEVLHSGHRPKPLESLYIDTTFCIPEALFIPHRQESAEAVIRLVEEWLNENPGNHVRIKGKASLGYEPLFKVLATHFKMKIHVSKSTQLVYKAIPGLAGFTTADPNTRIHACRWEHHNRHPKSKLPCGYLLEGATESSLRTIVVSTMFFTQRVNMDEFSVCTYPCYYRVCYSFHSSYSEVRDVVMHLQPKKVYPNVIPMDHTKQQIQDRLNRFLVLSRKCKVSSPDSKPQPLGKLRVRKLWHRKKKTNSQSDSYDSNLNFSMESGTREARAGQKDDDQSGKGDSEVSSRPKVQPDEAFKSKSEMSQELSLSPQSDVKDDKKEGRGDKEAEEGGDNAAAVPDKTVTPVKKGVDQKGDNYTSSDYDSELDLGGEDEEVKESLEKFSPFGNGSYGQHVSYIGDHSEGEEDVDPSEEEDELSQRHVDSPEAKKCEKDRSTVEAENGSKKDIAKGVYTGEDVTGMVRTVEDNSDEKNTKDNRKRCDRKEENPKGTRKETSIMISSDKDDSVRLEEKAESVGDDSSGTSDIDDSVEDDDDSDDIMEIKDQNVKKTKIRTTKRSRSGSDGDSNDGDDEGKEMTVANSKRRRRTASGDDDVVMTGVDPGVHSYVRTMVAQGNTMITMGNQTVMTSQMMMSSVLRTQGISLSHHLQQAIKHQVYKYADHRPASTASSSQTGIVIDLTEEDEEPPESDPDCTEDEYDTDETVDETANHAHGRHSRLTGGRYVKNSQKEKRKDGEGVHDSDSDVILCDEEEEDDEEDMEDSESNWLSENESFDEEQYMREEYGEEDDVDSNDVIVLDDSIEVESGTVESSEETVCLSDQVKAAISAETMNEREERNTKADEREEKDTKSEEREEENTKSEEREEENTKSEKSEEKNTKSEEREEKNTKSEKREEENTKSEEREEENTKAEEREEKNTKSEEREEENTKSEEREEKDTKSEEREERNTKSEEREEENSIRHPKDKKGAINGEGPMKDDDSTDAEDDITDAENDITDAIDNVTNAEDDIKDKTGENVLKVCRGKKQHSKSANPKGKEEPSDSCTDLITNSGFVTLKQDQSQAELFTSRKKKTLVGPKDNRGESVVDSNVNYNKDSSQEMPKKAANSPDSATPSSNSRVQEQLLQLGKKFTNGDPISEAEQKSDDFTER